MHLRSKRLIVSPKAGRRLKVIRTLAIGDNVSRIFLGKQARSMFQDQTAIIQERMSEIFTINNKFPTKQTLFLAHVYFLFSDNNSHDHIFTSHDSIIWKWNVIKAHLPSEVADIATDRHPSSRLMWRTRIAIESRETYIKWILQM